MAEGVKQLEEVMLVCESKAEILRRVAREMGWEVIEVKAVPINPADLQPFETVELKEVDGVWQLPKEA